MESKNYKVLRKIDGPYLAAISIGRTPVIHPLIWTVEKRMAIHFENQEEAQATIDFLAAVLDWELEYELVIESIQR